MKFLLLLTVTLVLTISSPAHAYLGPGMAAGAVAIVLGIIASFFLALFAVLWYPIKRMFKRRKKSKADTDLAIAEIATGPEATEVRQKDQ